MNLNFQHRGRQFFFFTFCVERRRPVLSRLCKGRGGPAPHGGGDATAHTELLPPGEAVLEFLKTLHSRTPALVASNRVVMPDHVHFILIVDFDRDPAFQPLSFAHRFMEETAAAAGGAGGPPPHPLSPFWEPSFWLVLSFSSRQLAARAGRPNTPTASPASPPSAIPSSIPPCLGAPAATPPCSPRPSSSPYA